MSNVALIGSFVLVYFYLLRLFNFCLLNLIFIYVMLGYHIRCMRCGLKLLSYSFVKSPKPHPVTLQQLSTTLLMRGLVVVLLCRLG